MIKQFTGGLLAIASVLGNPVLAGNTFEDHQRLYTMIERSGVPIFINHETLCERGNFGGGSYRWDAKSRESVMVICQENGRRNGVQVEWSGEDMDTLRHEAVHLIQDCASGTQADGNRQGIVVDTARGRRRVREILGERRANSIVKSYRSGGATAREIEMELEAFAIAETIEASVLTRTIDRVCTQDD